MLAKDCYPRLRKIEGKCWGEGGGGKGWLSLLKHLPCAREVANIVSISPTGIFEDYLHSPERDTRAQRSKENYMAVKLVSGTRGIQIQVPLAGKPTPFPSLPTYGLLQTYGVLVLFRNQENPHSAD